MENAEECIKCRRAASVSFRHLGELCRNCFLDVIEKRVRKGLRLSKAIRKNDKILIIDNGSVESAVGRHLLKRIIKGLPVRIICKKANLPMPDSVDKKSYYKIYDKIIIPWSLDDEAEEFLEFLFNKKKPLKFGRNAVKLLKPVSEDELAMFAKLNQLKYEKPGKKKPSKIRKMIGSL